MSFSVESTHQFQKTVMGFQLKDGKDKKYWKEKENESNCILCTLLSPPLLASPCCDFPCVCSSQKQFRTAYPISSHTIIPSILFSISYYYILAISEGMRKYGADYLSYESDTFSIPKNWPCLSTGSCCMVPELVRNSCLRGTRKILFAI